MKLAVIFLSLLSFVACNMEKGDDGHGAVNIVSKEYNPATQAISLSESGTANISIPSATIVELVGRPKHGNVTDCRKELEGVICVYKTNNNTSAEDSLTFSYVTLQGERNVITVLVTPWAGSGQLFKTFTLSRGIINKLNVPLKGFNQFSIEKFPNQVIISNASMGADGLMFDCVAPETNLTHDQTTLLVKSSTKQVELIITFNIEKAVDSDGDGIFDHLEKKMGRNPLINEIPFVEKVMPLYAELSVSDNSGRKGNSVVLKQSFERDEKNQKQSLLRKSALANLAKQKLGSINMDMRIRENGGIVAKWGHEEVLDAKIQVDSTFQKNRDDLSAHFKAQFAYATSDYPAQNIESITVKSRAARGSEAKEFSIAVADSSSVKFLSRADATEVEIETVFLDAKEGMKSLLGGDSFIVDISNYSYIDSGIQKEYAKEIEKAEMQNSLLLVSTSENTKKTYFAPGMKLMDMLKQIYSSNSFADSGRIIEIDGVKEDNSNRWHLIGKCDSGMSILGAGDSCHVILASDVEVEKSKRYIKGMNKQKIDSSERTHTKSFVSTPQDIVVLRGKLSGTRISTVEKTETVNAIFTAGYDETWCHNHPEDDHICPAPELESVKLQIKRKELTTISQSERELLSSAKFFVGNKEVRLDAKNVNSIKRVGQWIVVEASMPREINEISANTKIGLSFDEYCEKTEITFLSPQISDLESLGDWEAPGVLFANGLLLDINTPKEVCRTSELIADLDVLVE